MHPTVENLLCWGVLDLMISKGPIQPLCCDCEKISFCFKDTKIDKVSRVVLVIVKIKGEASLLVILFPPSLGGKWKRKCS